MKTAVKVLVIVGTVIGFIWSIVAVSGVVGGAIEAAFTKEDAKKEEIIEAATYAIIALIPTVAGLVFGLVCAREKSGKVTTIVNGLALLLCGIAAFAVLQQ